MTDKQTGGPAFPSPYDDDEGMTLRDYFAAKAMQANRSRHSDYESWADLTKDAYELADAMLKARDGQP